MALDVKDIRGSGLLELYVLGDISQEDQSIVRTAIATFPELQTDIKEIEYVLLQYAKLHSVEPSIGLKESIIKEIAISDLPRDNINSSLAGSKASSGTRYLGPLIASLLIALGLLAWTIFQNGKHKKLNAKYQSDQLICDSLLRVNQYQDQLFIALSDPGNKIIAVDPTENYSTTNFYVHYNQTAQKNYIQLVNLPEINTDQSFQLWALPALGSPIPLDVFQLEGDKIFEFSYVAGINAYAVTIEPRGGQTSPTLENLIGVVPLT